MRLIDADAVIRDLKRTCDWLNDDSPCQATARGFIHLLENLPTIEAEPVKHGRWIYKPYENDEAVWLYHCSKCNTVSATVKNYCPVCGTKMTEVING